MTPADAPVSLDQLRGLHLPAETAGSAQGAVVLAVALGLAAALLVGLVRHLRARRDNSVRRAALRDLATTKDLPLGARRVAQARLLRRLARTLRGEAAASTHGAAWAATLDGLFATTFFTQGAGRILVEGLYRPDPAEAPEMEAELTRLLARIGA